MSPTRLDPALALPEGPYGDADAYGEPSEASFEGLHPAAAAQTAPLKVLSDADATDVPEGWVYSEVLGRWLDPALALPESPYGEIEAYGEPAEAPATVRHASGENRDPDDPSTWGKVSRNAACPCGSGKKYKYCHGQLN